MQLQKCSLISYNSTSKPSQTPGFKGLQKPLGSCIFAFDLDGTFLNGTPCDIGRIMALKQVHNAKLVYVTGQIIEEFRERQADLAKCGMTIPTPDYFIENNGQSVFKNEQGSLVKNTEYSEKLYTDTNFERECVKAEMKKLARTPKYLYNEDEMKQLRANKNFDKIKENNPEFYDSKISYYEWSPSEFMTEYIVAADVDMTALKKEVNDALTKKGIKANLQEMRFPKEDVDACKYEFLLGAHELMRDKEGGLTALFVSAGSKSSGVEFLKEKLKMPYEEILMAGDGENDLDMAQMSRKGAFFICVHNAFQKLKNACKELQKEACNVFIAPADGTKGIVKGIENLRKREFSNV